MMSRLVSNAIGAALLSLATLPALAMDEGERVFKKVSPAVVTVLAFDEQGRQEGQGSGIITAPGRVVTNCHVVREARSLKVVSGASQHEAVWTLRAPELDLCLLDAKGVTAPPLPLRKLADIAIGEVVYAVGNPLGFGLSVSTGLVSRITPFQGEEVIVSSAPQSPGSSGGGLFDGEGRLLGITTGILGTGQNFNLVLPADSIAMLSTRGVAPPPAVVVPGPEPRWIEEAQALNLLDKWEQLERHAREWQAGQPSAALAAAYLGAALISQGRHQEAESPLREAVRLDERNEYAWRLLANALHALGDEEEAERSLARVRALHPHSDKLYSQKAEWLLAKGRSAEAAAEIHEAIRLNPGNSAHWRLLGRAEDQRGNAGEAAKAYRTALRLAPADTQLKQSLAQVLARQGRMEDARVALTQEGAVNGSEGETWLALGNGELQRSRHAAAEDAYRKAVEAAPGLAQAWAGLGIVLGRTHRPAEAIKAFDRAIEINPPHSAFVVETLLNRANLRHQLGSKGDALADLQRAIGIDPGSAGAYRLLGIMASESRDYSGAAAAFRKVVELGGAGADEWVSLGESLEKLGERGTALEALEQAERADAKNLRALQSLAGFHGRNGDVARALTYLDRALELDPSNPTTWSSKGYALLKLGRLEDAIDTLKTAVSLDPQLANGWINLGEAQLRSRNLGQAIQSLEKALALQPAAADARLYLAQSYLESRQPKKAKAHAEIIVDRYPGMDEALAVLTLSSLMTGDRKTALESYQQLQARDGAAAHALRAKAITQELADAWELPE